MPEVFFTIELPDGKKQQCYSPSSIVRSYFRASDAMPVLEFIARSRTALSEASERVCAKYGYACASAGSQLAEIERLAGLYPADSLIRIVSV
jgi:uncharacterized repeat protein (TIGR04042 family)